MPVSRGQIGGDDVWITVTGDREAIVDHESETWDATRRIDDCIDSLERLRADIEDC